MPRLYPGITCGITASMSLPSSANPQRALNTIGGAPPSDDGSRRDGLRMQSVARNFRLGRKAGCFHALRICFRTARYLVSRLLIRNFLLRLSAALRYSGIPLSHVLGQGRRCKRGCGKPQNDSDKNSIEHDNLPVIATVHLHRGGVDRMALLGLAVTVLAGGTLRPLRLKAQSGVFLNRRRESTLP
jgi:hypothetical protein